MFSPKSLTFGNVRSKPLTEIWREMQDSTQLQAIRNAALRKGPCASCKYFDECRGCASRIFAYGGDYFLSDPACPIGQAAAKTV
jgi:radical SAM protein with 4Fe4S-binding SPASM domain